MSAEYEEGDVDIQKLVSAEWLAEVLTKGEGLSYFFEGQPDTIKEMGKIRMTGDTRYLVDIYKEY